MSVKSSRRELFPDDRSESSDDVRSGSDSVASTTSQSTTAVSSMSSSTLSSVSIKGNEKIDYAFRIAFLGDQASACRALVHTLVYGQMNKHILKQDILLEKLTG